VDDKIKKNEVIEKFYYYLNEDVSKKDHGEELKIEERYKNYYYYSNSKDNQMFI
jgi:hypothetical protein